MYLACYMATACVYMFTGIINFTGSDTNFTMSNDTDTLYLRGGTRNSNRVVVRDTTNVSHYTDYK